MRKLLLATLALVLLAGCQTPSKTSAVPPASAAVAEPFWPKDGVFPVPGHTSSWSGFRTHNVERRTLFVKRHDIDQNGLVFVGDSITEGWKTLGADFERLSVKLVNRGIGGDTTPNLIYRLQEDVLSLHPRALVLMIGTNDLGEHTTPAQIAENLKLLHQRIRASYPKIPIAWCLVMPRKPDDTYPERIRELNARIMELAAKDPRVTVCDTFTPFAEPDGGSKPEDYVPDRLHLNVAGYEVWRTALEPILESWKLAP